MRPGLRALVLGGSGTVGSEVVRALCKAAVPTLFTYHRAEARARALEAETGACAAALDLCDAGAVRGFVEALPAEETPQVFIHCAVASRAAALAELTVADWDEAVAVSCRAPFVVCQALAPRLAVSGGGDVVLVGALDRAQSLPLPVHFAGTQGMLTAMAMALAKELGPSGVRVNVVALGALTEGISRTLPARALADYQSLSAFRRLGAPAEAARAIVWLALENRYMSGKVLAVNGGI